MSNQELSGHTFHISSLSSQHHFKYIQVLLPVDISPGLHISDMTAVGSWSNLRLRKKSELWPSREKGGAKTHLAAPIPAANQSEQSDTRSSNLSELSPPTKTLNDQPWKTNVAVTFSSVPRTEAQPNGAYLATQQACTNCRSTTKYIRINLIILS